VAVAIQSFAEHEVPARLWAQVCALHAQAWPVEEPQRLHPGHDPQLSPVSMVLVDDGLVLAALTILCKDIEHDGRRWVASGLSTVVTGIEHRGKGYGRQLVAAARAEISRRGADLAVFTCDRPMRRFYEQAGWSVLPGTVLVGGTPEDPLPSDQFDKVTLGDFFTVRAKRAAPVFRHSRIALYPGLLDRLW